MFTCLARADADGGPRDDSSYWPPYGPIPALDGFVACSVEHRNMPLREACPN